MSPSDLSFTWPVVTVDAQHLISLAAAQTSRHRCSQNQHLLAFNSQWWHRWHAKLFHALNKYNKICTFILDLLHKIGNSQILHNLIYHKHHFDLSGLHIDLSLRENGTYGSLSPAFMWQSLMAFSRCFGIGWAHGSYLTRQPPANTPEAEVTCWSGNLQLDCWKNRRGTASHFNAANMVTLGLNQDAANR